MSVIVGGEKLKKFIQKVAQQKAQVDVGFFPNATYPDGTQIAEVAIRNEYGNPIQNVPARPFLQATFDENKSKWFKFMANDISNQGENIDVAKTLSKVGFIAQNDVQGKIDWWASVGTPRNAEYTINKKGFDSPLIETGAMRDAVSFEVKSK